mmetsp:Transcript_16702/g.45824  ORF Transcript_16702/g.45824 Transcript_16702/m.45824 type:complete len:241 (-) Transcript_16702:701-1423(-)
MSSTGGTGHDEFDRLATEFSSIIKEIEAELYERSRINGASDKVHGGKTAESVRKASSILAKLSSVTKSITDAEELGLRQELVDVYKAYKMQLKTYKSLNQQPESFWTENTTKASPATKSTSERSLLFSSASKTTEGCTEDSSPRYDEGSNKGNGIYNSNRSRDRITSSTQGRVSNQNSQLQYALRSIHESEQVAQEISGELQSQRESLRRTQGRMDKFTSMTEYSNKLLNSMNKPWWRKW